MQHEVKRAAGSVVDPVCGMQVDPERAPARREHAGRQYFFCCSSCAERFSSEPDKYLQPRANEPPAQLVQLGKVPLPSPGLSPDQKPPSVEQASRRYFCSMDPEVTSASPGSCPKCGMALEPELLSSAKTEYVCPMHPEV